MIEDSIIIRGGDDGWIGGWPIVIKGFGDI